MFNKKWRWLLLFPLILLLVTGGFVVWAATPSGSPMPEALEALQSDDQVQVTTDSWLVFTPVQTEPTTGFIFYPGGRVLPEAYAPAARQLAEAGYLTVIVPMPLNLAIFNANAAADVIAAYPQITAWALGGHSLGGAMAANFVKTHPDAVQGLVLWAAYPQASDTLADQTNLAVTSIYGTYDGLATVDKIEESRQYLPAATLFVAIEGGNHAFFGWYGDQSGDNPAIITREEQQDQIVTATRKILSNLNR